MVCCNCNRPGQGNLPRGHWALGRIAWVVLEDEAGTWVALVGSMVEDHTRGSVVLEDRVVLVDVAGMLVAPED